MVIPDLPNATEWRAWKAKIVNVIAQGLGRAEQNMVTQWVMEASLPGATVESLKKCSTALVSLDENLMTGILHVLKNSKRVRAKIIDQTP